jgi:hypothetical protein
MYTVLCFDWRETHKDCTGCNSGELCKEFVLRTTDYLGQVLEASKLYTQKETESYIKKLKKKIGLTEYKV